MDYFNHKVIQSLAYYLGLITTLLGIVSVSCQAQCDVVPNAGEDQVICTPQLVQLEGGFIGNAIDYYWTPGIDLSDSTILNPNVFISTTSTFTLNVFGNDPSAPNLVNNGDFEAGNTGFSSDYNYVVDIPASQNEMWSEGTYAIVTNPNFVHANFSPCSDHTSGNGNMMVINGAANYQDIWCQSISVNPNSWYNFSAWVASVHNASPAQLQFSINGTPLGEIFNASAATCNWQEFYTPWYSGSETMITICIINLNTAPSGNDFALDDISFTEVCVMTDDLTIHLLAPEAIIETPPFYDCNSVDSCFTLDATGSTTGTDVVYNWYTSDNNSQIISGSSTLTPYVCGFGPYILEVEQSFGDMACLVYDTVEIISDNAYPDIPIISGEFYACANQILVYSTPFMPGINYEWIIPFNGTILNGQGTNSIIVQFFSAIEDEICLLVSNICENYEEECFPIQIDDVPSIPDVEGPIGVCKTQSASFDIFTGTVGVNIIWEVPAGAQIISGQYTPSINVSFEDAVDGEICVYVENYCGIDSSCITVEVSDNFLTEVDSSICAGDSIIIDGIYENSSGVYTEDFVSIQQCDSTVSISLAVIDPVYIDTQIYTCFLSETGIDTIGSLSQENCDSTTYIETIYVGSDTTVIYLYSCEPSDTGITIFNHSNAFNCDSVVYIDIGFKLSDTILISQQSCDLIDIGIDSFFDSNLSGCDSLTILQTDWIGYDTVFITEYTCNVVDTGLFSYIVPGTTGCDSATIQYVIWRGLDSCDTEGIYYLEDAECSDSLSTLIITPTIGLAPFQYLVTGPSGNILGMIQHKGDQAIIDLLPGGLYNVILSSDIGIEYSFSVDIPFLSVLHIDVMSTFDFNGFQLDCYGSNVGGASVEYLSVGYPPYTIEWSNGESTDEISGLTEGIYSVTVTDALGCDDSSLIELIQPPPLDINFDTYDPLCFGDENGQLVLSNIGGGVGSYEVYLNNSQIDWTSDINSLSPGSFTLLIQDGNQCNWESSFELIEPDPIEVDIGRDKTITLGEELILLLETNLTYSAISQIIWDPDVCNCPEFSLLTYDPLEVSVTVIDTNGCIGTDQLKVFIDRNIKYYIPNAFSPTNDGINDWFYVNANSSVKEIERILIYNRWGDLIFETHNITPNDEKAGWDGTHLGDPVSAGVYVYVIEMLTIDDIKILEKGDVTLVK
jgi:gliding motility-associated-like protein